MLNRLKKPALIMISIVSSLFFLWLALKNVDWALFWQNLQKADWKQVILAMFIFVFAYFLRTLRWRSMFAKSLPKSFKNYFDTLVSSFAINNLLPLRAGDISRMFLAQKLIGTSKSFALGTVVVERVWDGVALVILALSSLAILHPAHVPQKLILTASILFGVLVIIIISLDRIWQVVTKRFRPQTPKIKLIFEKLDKLISSFQVSRQLGVLLFIVLFSLMVWLTEAIVYWQVANSLSIDINYIQSCLVVAILNFGILIPSSPGYVGTFEYFSALGLSIFGIKQTQAISFAILLHVTQYIPITFYGLFVIFRFGRSIISYDSKQ